MARKKKSDKKPIEQYQHKDKERVNNPPVGLVTPETDKDETKTTYSYDPHLDPQLVWAGKAEHTSFELPTVSLHVHERIDPRTIISAVKKRNGEPKRQASLFEFAGENPPIREAIEFYKHKHGWSNRLVAGDSLLVMNSLLEKEGIAGKVQIIYIDPPYGIKYGSNFQPFVNKRDVKDGKDEDLTSEPEMIRAFRDTWELGIHSYLTYLRDRLLLARELLTDSGSVFVQISDENVHHIKEVMDEIFDVNNFISIIPFIKTGSTTSQFIPSVVDYLLWYAKDKNTMKYRQLFIEKNVDSELISKYPYIEDINGNRKRISKKEIHKIPTLIKEGYRLCQLQPLHSQHYSPTRSVPFTYNGSEYSVPPNRQWATSIEGLEKLGILGRLEPSGNTLRFVRYLDDFSAAPLYNTWTDTSTFTQRTFVVQTNEKVINRCILMTTDPGDLVFDPTCGSGTTAFSAEQWGRRWITCDTSRIAIALAKQRLMTSIYDYYELAHPTEGVGSGFKYKTVPHITLGSIANNEPLATETLYDQPFVDNSKTRVSGPFTVEAVPSPVVKPLDDVKADLPADESVARSGETLRQSEWKDELFRTGIRGKGGQSIEFTRLETLPGTRWLHVDGETKEKEPKRIVVSFGPEHAPLEQRQVELALEEAQKLVPKPKMILFASFQFDPEASKDIDETDWSGVTLLKAQMNADLLTEDLKKKRSSNESFWLMGQPDVSVKKLKDGKIQVEVLGFDYYNTRTGIIDSGSSDKIAMWMLDTDYDGRSLYPRQVFFPMAGAKEGWAKLAKNLKAEIDQDLIEAYRGTVSLPFERGEHKQIAVKIVDDRGIESLRIIGV
ncbi:MAG: site-specific DNA-methyltransferase [Desulfobacterales bacterium]